MFASMTRDQKTILWILVLINLVNYLDRQIVFPLFSHIKAEFALTDFHLGLLGTGFLFVHSLAIFPLGVLADRFSRKKIISFGVLFWSIASFASGLASGFKSLLGIRSLVGIGEASYAPAAMAMITDNFPGESNARVQGLFNVGMLVGGTFGAVLGGLIAYYFNNWRLAFFIGSLPGFLLAYLILHVKDVTLVHDEPKIPLHTLFQNSAYIWIIISGTFVSFASGAFITWGIEFITRYKGYNLRDAGLVLGIGMMISSVIGVLIGSFVADYLQKKHSWGRSIVVCISLICSAPLMYIGLLELSKNMFLFFFFLGATFLSVYLGPVTAVLHDIVPKQFRASAVAGYVLISTFIGQTFAPAIIGKISDIYDLRTALQFATLFVFLAGISFIPVIYLISKNFSFQIAKENISTASN